MKEQTLLQMKNKVETLTDSNLYLLREIAHIRELAVGTLETLKLIDGYTEAIETLKTNIKENEAKAKTEAETKTETLLEL